MVREAGIAHERWLVAGRVQGVGFRWFVRQAALAERVAGQVRNRKDGTVEIVAHGEAPRLRALLAAVRGGPAGARVDDVSVEPWTGTIDENDDFRIVR